MSAVAIGPALIVAACVLLAAGAVFDVAFRIIPNRLCLIVFVLALGARVLAGDLLPALLAGAAVFLAALVCWRRGWLGGGDVKLLAASVLLVPPGAVPAELGAVAFAGGALAAGYLLAARLVRRPHGARPAALVRRILRAECWRVSGRRSVPYGCAIAAGAVITLLNG